MKYDEMKAAVEKFFSDTTRGKEETLHGLEAIQSEIEIMIDSIENDIDNELDEDEE